MLSIYRNNLKVILSEYRQKPNIWCFPEMSGSVSSSMNVCCQKESEKDN